MKMENAVEIKRDNYGAIKNAPAWVRELLVAAERAGCWESGIESDRKNRGTAINVAIYGYDEAEGIVVVQVREARFRPKRFTKVRKDYYLVGRVESGAVFAHPIDSPIRSTLCLADPQYCADYARAKIWGCKISELSDIIRQGDIALIPVPRLPASAVDANGQTQILRETHRIEGEKIWLDGKTIYVARGVKIVHMKREHKTVRAKAGYYKVIPGYRAVVWGFTRPTAD